MNNLKFYNKRLDSLLETFDAVSSGRIEKTLLFNDAPDDFYEALSLLVEEGYLEEDRYSFKITYKGKFFRDQGGFVRQYRRERALFYCTVIAAVSGVLCLLASIVALLR